MKLNRKEDEFESNKGYMTTLRMEECPLERTKCSHLVLHRSPFWNAQLYDSISHFSSHFHSLDDIVSPFVSNTSSNVRGHVLRSPLIIGLSLDFHFSVTKSNLLLFTASNGKVSSAGHRYGTVNIEDITERQRRQSGAALQYKVCPWAQESWTNFSALTTKPVS